MSHFKAQIVDGNDTRCTVEVNADNGYDTARVWVTIEDDYGERGTSQFCTLSSAEEIDALISILKLAKINMEHYRKFNEIVEGG